MADNKTGLKIACPHCNSPTYSRTTRRVTRLVREAYLVCHDPECGFTFVAQLQIVRELSPSARPSDQVHLPKAPAASLRRRTTEVPANDDAPISDAIEG